MRETTEKDPKKLRPVVMKYLQEYLDKPSPEKNKINTQKYVAEKADLSEAFLSRFCNKPETEIDLEHAVEVLVVIGKKEAIYELLPFTNTYVGDILKTYAAEYFKMNPMAAKEVQSSPHDEVLVNITNKSTSLIAGKIENISKEVGEVRDHVALEIDVIRRTTLEAVRQGIDDAKLHTTKSFETTFKWLFFASWVLIFSANLSVHFSLNDIKKVLDILVKNVR